MLDTLRAEDFQPLIGQEIDVDAHGERVKLEVATAAAIPSPSPRAAPPFHLILKSTANWRAAQGIFRLHHPRLGTIDVFTVPVGPADGGFCYEVIFN
jgi:hypothetical protein